MQGTGRGRPARRKDAAGTVAILLGTVTSAASVLVYQPVAGRALGTEGFAPIAVLWTMMFVVYTVLMIPVEQFITRRIVITDGVKGWLGADRRVVFGLLLVSWVLGVGFVLVTLDTFFEGASDFIVITAVLLVARAIMAVSRGMLAGRRRFVAYGGTLASEAFALLSLAVIAAVSSPTTITFAWALVVGPLTSLLFRPWRSETERTGAGEAADAAAVFLGWLVVATAASQVVIASAPIIVGFIGGTSAAVSIVFATFTLFRGPVTSAYNVVARVLPDFTELAVRGDAEALVRWRHRIGLAGGGLAVAGAAVGYAAGPWVVTLLYGAEFEPPGVVAALGGAGVGSGLGALFVGQIFIAAGRTKDLAVAWLGALCLAALVVVAAPAEPMLRISWGFAVGESAALVFLGVAPRRAPVDPGEADSGPRGSADSSLHS